MTFCFSKLNKRVCKINIHHVEAYSRIPESSNYSTKTRVYLSNAHYHYDASF